MKAGSRSGVLASVGNSEIAAPALVSLPCSATPYLSQLSLGWPKAHGWYQGEVSWGRNI